MGTKPWRKSLTLIGGTLFAALAYLEQQGVIAAGTGQAAQDALAGGEAAVTGGLAQLAVAAKYGSGLLALIGLRRSSGQPPLSGLLMAFILLALPFASATPAVAQTTCQGGTATAPACSRNWATGPLNVLACPADPATGAVAGETLVLRELNGTPLLSVTAGTPGGQLTLAASQAPRAPAGSTVRVIEFRCTASGFSTGGAATFATITFPQIPASAPVAPTVL